MKNSLIVFFCCFFGLVFAEPPRQIPEDLRDQYTLNGMIPVLVRPQKVMAVRLD